MGLCGSKPQNKHIGENSNKGKVSISQKSVTKDYKPDETLNNEKLTPREAARKAAEEREAKINAENSKSELSRKLAKERAKSRTAYVGEIARG